MDNINHGFTKLGAIDKPVDPLDIHLGKAGAPVYTFAPKLTNTDAFAMPVEYQGQQPACGSHAGAEIKDLSRHGRFSPRFTWGDLKSFDGWPIDMGTDIRSVFKSITKAGVLDFAQLGNDVTLSETEYAKAPTADQRALAIKASGSGYGFITDKTFNGLKQFISDHGPTILQLRVGNEWWTSPAGVGSWAEKDILPVRPPNPVTSGHFVVAHSYDENFIYFINHWSAAWGRAGHGYLGADYIPYLVDAGALFPLGFTKDLYLGMTDGDVQKLQQYLNNHGFGVAATGPGSVGQETTYYGTLTQNAVKKFQAAHSIPNTGYFGPLTRAYVQLHP